jgi:hypothetical protein
MIASAAMSSMHMMARRAIRFISPKCRTYRKRSGGSSRWGLRRRARATRSQRVDQGVAVKVSDLAILTEAQGRP